MPTDSSKMKQENKLYPATVIEIDDAFETTNNNALADVVFFQLSCGA